MTLLSRMAADMGLSSAYIHKIAVSASHRYKVYSVRKRTGGRRVIEHPARELKLLQTWLLDKLFSHFRASDSVYSYRIGKSIRGHANNHRRNSFLLKIDLKDFFPSITSEDVYKFLKDRQNDLSSPLTPTDCRLIAAIVCRRGRLTIGAPSSPAISNSILYRFDLAIATFCRQRGVTYTRYADDLFFSTNTPNLLTEINKEVRRCLSALPYPRLKINPEKTVFTSRKRLRLVTGVVLTSDKRLSVGRAKKRMLRTLVYLFSTDRLDEKKTAYLRGNLAYVASIEPTFIGSLEKKFGKRVLDRLHKQPLINLKPKSRSAEGFK
ncbi:MAG: RNA-directed DNA polymerase [Betaproteobacteria bacterium]|nr:RNA-directed DNA polymerase [Betaproteobacteria bacterium]